MKLKMAFATVAFAVVAAWAANMASQNWVEMKLDEVEKRLLVSRAVLPMAVDAGTNGTVYAFYEAASVASLSVTNSANESVTNGTLFAWAGDGVYTNAAIGSAVFATQTNFVWNSVQSSVVDGIDTFALPASFSVIGMYITPSQASAIIGE